MTSKSVSVPTTMTGNSSNSAIASAIDTISLSASASACQASHMHHFTQSLFLLLLLAKNAAWVVVFEVGEHHLKQKCHFLECWISGKCMISAGPQVHSLLVCTSYHDRKRKVAEEQVYQPRFLFKTTKIAKKASISSLVFRTQVILLNKRLGLANVFCSLTLTVLLLATIVFTLSLRCRVMSVNFLPAIL